MTKLIRNQKRVATGFSGLADFGGEFIRQSRAKFPQLGLRGEIDALEALVVPAGSQTPEVQLEVTRGAENMAIPDTLARERIPVAGGPMLRARRSRFFRPDVKDQFHSN
jgi:hypothetical protein